MNIIDELEKSIKANRLVMRKLNAPLKTLEQRAERQKQKRRERFEKLTEFSNLEEARTAYGMGWISRKRFEEVQDYFEHEDDFNESEISAEEVAYNILFDFYKKISTQELHLGLDLIAERKKGGEKRERLDRR